MKYIAVLLQDQLEVGREVVNHNDKNLILLSNPYATDVKLYPATLTPNRFLIESLKAYNVSQIDEDGNFSVQSNLPSITGDSISKLISLANVFGYALEIKTNKHLTVYFNRQ